MGKPTIVQRIRQTLGRALRETGQALDRVGIRGQKLATTKRVLGDDPLIFQDHLSRHRHQMPLLRRGKPVVSKDVAFLAPCSTLIGSVYIGAGSSVFYKSILRADNCDHAEAFQQQEEENENETTAPTTDTQVQPQSHAEEESSSLKSIHEWELDPNRFSRTTTTATGGGIFIGEYTNIQDGCIIDSARDHTRIGNGVTVGHLASIHSATVEDHCLIGMGAMLQPGVVVKEESFIAAGANVTEDTVVESGELWVGNPAWKLRDLTTEERQKLHYQADEYVKVASTQQEVMLLGGNLPEVFSSEHHDHVVADSDDSQEEPQGQEQQQDEENDKRKAV